MAAIMQACRQSDKDRPLQKAPYIGCKLKEQSIKNYYSEK